MNKQERMLLNLCMSDQLFCTMYDGLNYMHLDYHSPSPAMVWLKSLTAFHDIYESPRPDIMVDIALEGADESVIATVFYMAMVQDMGQRQEPTELKDALCRKLASCTHWRELYERIRNSEEKEECKGRLVNSTDFSSRELPVFSDTSTKAIAVEELVDMTLSMNNVTFSRGVAYLLRRLDDSRDGAFRSEIVKLERFADSFNVKTNAQLYNPQNEMFRKIKTKRSAPQNEMFLFRVPSPHEKTPQISLGRFLYLHVFQTFKSNFTFSSPSSSWRVRS